MYLVNDNYVSSFNVSPDAVVHLGVGAELLDDFDAVVAKYGDNLQYDPNDDGIPAEYRKGE